MIGVAVLVLGLFGWGLGATIAGAVIAPGKIVVETRQQVVQHPDGGVVDSILVKDGDRVQAGDVLIRLDGTLLRSEETNLDSQYWELVARRNRLEAEQFQADEIAFDPELLARAQIDPRVQMMVDGQRILYTTRDRSEAEQIEQLRERQAQIEQQIGGSEAQIAALDRQLELIGQELVGQQRLFDQGLAQLTRLLSLQREEARLRGQIGELTAAIAQARGQRSEIAIQILLISTQRQEQAISEMRDIQFQENQVREQLVALRERLSRLEIRSPITGEVLGMTVFAVRSVVRPAEPILYVVPSDVDFIISAQIETVNVDSVYPGQPATLKFSAFSTRTTPDINGHVKKVSADALEDEQRGFSYYTVELGIDEGEMEKLTGLTLIPGMPVEAYIRTQDRSPLNYLVRPFTDYFSRAMRED
jgi:HlyD family secretion protein